MNIREQSGKLTILEKKEDGTLTISAIFLLADTVNRNNRIYPHAVVQKEIARLKSTLKETGMLSASRHVENGPDVGDISHIVQSVDYNPISKQASLTMSILPTSKGKDIATILNHGGALGLSLRGKATVKKESGVDVIGEDFELEGVDIVLSPSFNTRFSKANVLESVEFKEEEQKAKDEKQYKAFLRDLGYGFSGSFADYKKSKAGAKK